MNHLFERFVTVQLKRHLVGRLDVVDQEQTHLDIGRKIPVRPDLVFYRRREPVLVADIKYKIVDDGLGRNTDYHQLLAYCAALGLREGVLIYAAEGESEQPSTVHVRSHLTTLSLFPINTHSRSHGEFGIANLARELDARGRRGLRWTDVERRSS
jgi:5-methylcytosine-specific restriction enzyme subunit McrC